MDRLLQTSLTHSFSQVFFGGRFVQVMNIDLHYRKIKKFQISHISKSLFRNQFQLLSITLFFQNIIFFVYSFATYFASEKGENIGGMKEDNEFFEKGIVKLALNISSNWNSKTNHLHQRKQGNVVISM